MKYAENQLEDLNPIGIRIRKKILDTLHYSGGGHFGGSMSVADILVTLYYRILVQGMDRVILSKGHAAAALYSILSEFNFISPNSLKEYGRFNAGLEGHPDMLTTRGLDFSTGSLGQGLSVGLGMSIGMMKDFNRHVWVILGDGECQEGQIWEAAMLASRYQVKNLHVIIDANNAQECGFKFNSNLLQEPIPELLLKWQAFGWKVIEVDGHNYIELEEALICAKKSEDMPSVIVARTKKGFGVKLFQNNPEVYHCATLTDDEYNLALQELGK